MSPRFCGLRSFPGTAPRLQKLVQHMYFPLHGLHFRLPWPKVKALEQRVWEGLHGHSTVLAGGDVSPFQLLFPTVCPHSTHMEAKDGRVMQQGASRFGTPHLVDVTKGPLLCRDLKRPHPQLDPYLVLPREPQLAQAGTPLSWPPSTLPASSAILVCRHYN